MFKKYIKTSLICSVLICNSLVAEDGFDDEFDSDEVIEVVKIEKQQKFTFYGSVSADGQYRYDLDDNKLSNKLSANLKFDYTLDKNHKIKSSINTYKNYGTSVPNDTDFDINELSVEGTFKNNIDMKIGRQIVVWGKSDNIRITDILNPLDLTTPGMVDIKDLRLGRNMTKLDYYIGKWALSGIMLHENRYSKIPSFGSEYTTSNQTIYKRLQVQEPSSSIENSGFALSLAGNLEGQDLSFYLANQYVDNTTYRSNMAGFAYNIVNNSFLYKTEIAYFDNYDSNIVKSKTDGLAGIEYTGISDGSISLEVANKSDTMQYAVRFSQSYLNETLDLTVLFNGYGKECENGGFNRVWFDYDYNDDIQLTFGVISYFGGQDPKFELIKNNDRVFTTVKYSF
jgi:hypothetical protein